MFGVMRSACAQSVRSTAGKFGSSPAYSAPWSAMTGSTSRMAGKRVKKSSA